MNDSGICLVFYSRIGMATAYRRDDTLNPVFYTLISFKILNFSIDNYYNVFLPFEYAGFFFAAAAKPRLLISQRVGWSSPPFAEIQQGYQACCSMAICLFSCSGFVSGQFINRGSD